MNNQETIDFDFQKYYKKEWERVNRFIKIQTEQEHDVTTTSKLVIWKKNKSTLYYYPPEKQKYKTPILIVYSLVNKPFILDLLPGSSFIEGMVKHGYPVYLLDWGEPGPEDNGTTIEDYIISYLDKSVKRVLRHSGAEELSILGYCLGGTIASIYTAISNAPIKNLILATVPIDFSTLPGPKSWAKALKSGSVPIDKFIDRDGNVPAETMKYIFRMLTYPIYYTPYISLYDRVMNDSYVEKWKRLNKWTEGHVSFAGASFLQFFNDFLKDNKLIKGEFMVRGKRVNLSNIKSNIYLITSSNDNLVPESQSIPLMEKVNMQDRTHETVKAGHISLALSPLFVEMTNNWLKDRSVSVN